MLALLLRSIKYNLSAHLSNLPNLLAGAIGMAINNVIYLLGMWGMLFAGKTENQPLLFYYLALNTLVMAAWGAINFFFGGWIELGELIVSGHFESKLSTPRHPLLLVAMHSLQPAALGDLVMGLLGIAFLAFWGPRGMALRTSIASVISILALLGLFVFSGSLAFFLPRGNAVAQFVRETTLSLCCYPVGKMFPSGAGRLLLLLTPAATVALLPMEWIEEAGLVKFAVAGAGVIAALFLSFGVYSLGVRRFQSISLIGAQS